MPQKNRGDQKSEHAGRPTSETTVGNLRWDDLKYFLSVADTGSFRAAAELTETSINAVRKRISDLEYELNCVLFSRSPTGAELTADGRSVYSVAVEIRERVKMLDLVAVRKGASNEGLVRIATTEGLGTFWIMRKLNELTTRFPKIRIDFRCEMKVPDLSRLECDIAVQLEEPRDNNLIKRKIGTLHLMFFATQDYLVAHGVPKSVNDLENHTLIHLVADQIPSHLLEQKVKTDPQFRFVRVITNTSSSQVMAIAEGAGLGVLPSYATALSRRLIPIETDFQLSRPIWLVYHPEAIKLRRVRSVADWIINTFDPKENPWFQDRFIKPEQFEAELENTKLFRRALDWNDLKK
jgi:DNA-binding transcriptional LysR family regulator